MKEHALNLKDAVNYLKMNAKLSSFEILLLLKSGDLKAYINLGKSKNTEFLIPANYWDKKSVKSIRYLSNEDEDNFTLLLSHIYHALLEDFLFVEAEFSEGRIPNFEQETVLKFWFQNFSPEGEELLSYKKRYLELKTIFMQNINNSRIVQIKIDDLNTIIENSVEFALPKIRKKMMAEEVHWHLIIKQLQIGKIETTAEYFADDVLKSIRKWENDNNTDLHLPENIDAKPLPENKDVKPLSDDYIKKLAGRVWKERGMHDILTKQLKEKN